MKTSNTGKLGEEKHNINLEDEMPLFTPMLNTKEVAKILGLKETTLEQWRWAGRGPRYVKAGRSVRYTKEDLEAFITGRSFGNTTELEAGRA